ncbi:MAG: hypothetical protein NTY19_43075 [Planctomycetota bacterium]|nr:hypothetical protein [Planctomycetota bacterium]
MAELTAKQAAFVAAVEDGKAVSAAAALARVNPTTHYRWMAQNESYRRTIRVAEEMAWDRFFAVASDRALNGVRRLVFYRGKAIIDPRIGEPYVEIKYDDRLLILLLRLMRPEKYGYVWGAPAAYRRQFCHRA